MKTDLPGAVPGKAKKAKKPIGRIGHGDEGWKWPKNDETAAGGLRFIRGGQQKLGSPLVNLSKKPKIKSGGQS
jgi:hypothetical protein